MNTKVLLAAILLAMFMIAPAIANPAWVSAGGCWTYKNTTTNVNYVMWNVTTAPTSYLIPADATSISFLVLAGGGGGGSAIGGGGGAGGLLTGTLTGLEGTRVPVVVGYGGAGGAAGTSDPGKDGGASQFGSINATGGGAGGKLGGPGATGGSGGGGGGRQSANGGSAVASPVQGLAGGNGLFGSDTTGGGGGGGGNGTAGSSASGATPGAGDDGANGGAGRYLYFNGGEGAWYAAGGGGGWDSGSSGVGGTGGSGIGGNGASGTAATAGVANTGSGGGAGQYSAPYQAGASGGIGIVIIAYTSSIPVLTVSPSASSTYGALVNISTSISNSSATNWTFGDGYTATTRDNASHWYSVAGNYTITYSITTGTSTFTNYTAYFNLTSDSDSNLKSWMHNNGVTGGTTFPDLMGNAWSANSVTTDTTTYRFGNGSARFNSNNDFLTTASSKYFNFSTSPFTIEMQVRPTASGSNQYIVSRATSSTTKSDGWGIYHSTTSAASDGWVFYAGTAATGSTGTFTLPLNVWSNLSVQRYSNGTVFVYVDGNVAANKTGLTGNYDTANPVNYGRPSSGSAGSAFMNLDEARISTTARWTGPYAPPYAEYRGDPYATADINPSSTLRYKTNPDSSAVIANLTQRYRTAQIQYVNNATNISFTMTFNPNHYRAISVLQNSTHFSGINFTYVSIDNNAGTVIINATRPTGFSTIGLVESRGSVADIPMNYWNYTSPSYDFCCGDDDIPNIQFFSNGFLRNGTTAIEYPVMNYIATNVTPVDWVTYSNFTVNNSVAIIGVTPILFNPELNMSASRYLWDFGDGTTFLSANTTVSHVYTTPGLKRVNLTAYLWQNTSVINTTSIVNAVNVTYLGDYVAADFTGNPTSGSVGLNVLFTDSSYFQNTTNRVYNWSFGDGYYSSQVGNVNHVYSALGIYTVSLAVANDFNVSTTTKMNYITISNNQQTTFYVPKQVMFRFYDTNNIPQSGLVVTATPMNFTAPSNWAEILIGVSPSVNITGTTLTGITGTEGSWVAPVLPSQEYSLHVTGSGIDYTFTIYPQQDQYDFTLPIGMVPIPTSVASIVTYTLANVSVNSSYQYFNMSYSDTSSSGTTNLTFAVYNISGYPIDSISYEGAAANAQTYSALILVSQGQTYTYGVFANQSSYGWINQTETVTLANQIALIGSAPSWVEMWFAIAVILIFSALFSIFSKPIAMVGMPLLTYWFQYGMGWLPSSFLSAITLGIMLTIGVLIYIRQKENMLT